MEINSSIERDVRDILEDLSYLSNLPTGYKYTFTNRSYVAANSYVGAMYRTMYDESKDVTIDYFHDCIDRAIEIGRKYPSWVDQLAIKVKGLNKSLINLKHTYSTKYAAIGSVIDVLVIRIDTKAFKNACLNEANEDN